MKKSLSCLCILLASVLLFGACQKETKTPAGPSEKITIAYPRSSYAIPFQVALAKGFFAAEGLEVTAQPHEFGKIALRTMMEGKADMAISGDTPVMFAIIAGNKISIVAAIATSKKNEAVVAREDLGIKTPQDLKGKRIGATFGTTGHFFLESFLSAQGIDKNKVRIIDMGPGEMMDALTKGKIDAVAIWNPAIKQFEKELGSNGVVFYDESIYSDMVCVSVLQEFTKKHPETIKKVLRAIIKAETFIKEKPDESQGLVAEFFKIDKAVIVGMWNIMNFVIALDQSLLVRLEDQTRWAQKNRFTDSSEAPNYLDHIYFDGLQSIKPEAVRIIR
ncbi:MAG: NrtA/SsuA/CpmA family ABC transporter substrate-binding protein [Lentisphaerae bacterium]|nr:NrtA/SsuA/CpmA family ABC transporter substrate-binding protein [Lentisphaerota bacterium]